MNINLLDVSGFLVLHSISLSYDERRAEQCVVSLPDKPRESIITALIKRGPSHAKFLRCIHVHMVIAAPRYWFAEFDTYKIGVTAWSQSTMHTLTKRKLEREDFVPGIPQESIDIVNSIIDGGDLIRAKAALPEGFLQARYVCANYQALRTMYQQRRKHRLVEWRGFCTFLETLPHAEYITGDSDG